jgi:aryl-alcohol dehydrogenase-like predicted oxidoreductase
MGLGLAALGRPGYLDLGHAEALGDDRSVPALRARTFEVLDAAWAAGIRWFDAARSYGLAEDFLGEWLTARAVRPEDVTVSSKWGYSYTAAWRADAEVHEVKDHRPSRLREQSAESRERLGRWLDLYQIHSATLETGVLTDPLVLTELAALADGGLAIGLSVSGPRQADTIRQALAAEIDGVNPFRSVQATWNLLEPSAGAALAEAAGAGWTVLVKEAVANGRLAPGGSLSLAPSQRLVLSGIEARLRVTRDALALAAVLAQPWAALVLSGAATAGQLTSNLGALAVSPAAADLDELVRLAEPPERYWRTRSELPWT